MLGGNAAACSMLVAILTAARTVADRDLQPRPAAGEFVEKRYVLSSVGVILMIRRRTRATMVRDDAHVPSEESAMGAVDKAKNTTQRAKGKLKEVAGKVSGDNRLRRQGKADQMMGRLKQTGEKVKDAFKK
jgi:uncharacterized protein YjbJ (UPF0337 family)